MTNEPHNLTDSEYLNHLKQQYDFLLSDVEQYEKGNPQFAVKIAATLRTIFHNTPTSKAILPDLAQKYGYRLRFKSRQLGLTSLDDSTTLYIGFMVGNRILPRDYFNAPFFIDSDFETYWNAIVYKEGSTIYTRKQMILFAANKWGGAHVDPEIPHKFLRLIDGTGPKLISKQCGEEMIIGRIPYEMAIQVIIILQQLIPFLEKETNR
jgi:hypothetical protein